MDPLTLTVTGKGGTVIADVSPSQYLANHYSPRAVEKIEEVRELRRRESEMPGRDDGSGEGEEGHDDQSRPE